MEIFNKKIINLEKIKDMAHGENPYQKAALYENENTIKYEVIDNKELTYNNILNLTSVIDILSEFYDVNAVAIVRHAKPCGVALGSTIYDAYTKAFDCDSLSSFEGTFGFSRSVDAETAGHIVSMAVKLVVAPEFDSEALEILKTSQELTIVKLKTSLQDYKKMKIEEIIRTPFGTLVQDKNNSSLDKDSFKVVTKTKPAAEQIEDAIFAWNIAKHAKTNAVVIAKDFKTLSIGQGYTNSLIAFEGAIKYACDGTKDAVAASDSVLFAEDIIYLAAQNRISLIIQPGGATKDKTLIDLADKYKIAMVTTGIKTLKV